MADGPLVDRLAAGRGRLRQWQAAVIHRLALLRLIDGAPAGVVRPRRRRVKLQVVEGDRLWYVTSRGEVVCLDTEGFIDGQDDGPALGVWSRPFELMLNPDQQADWLKGLSDGRISSELQQKFRDRGIAAVQATTGGAGNRWELSGVAEGNYADAVEAASAFEGVLGAQLAQGRGIAAQVSDAFGAGHGLHADGGLGAVGDAMEQLAVSAARLMASR